MPEERNEQKLSGDVKLTSPLLTKLENFWYHYKWPFLFGLFFLVAITVCFTQCAANGRGNDAFVMVAGAPAPTPSQMRDIEDFLEGYTDDRNGDEKIIVAMQKYTIYTEEEINTLVLSDARPHAKELSYNDKKAFQQDLEATLCFLGVELYEEEAKAGGLLPLSEITATLPAAGVLVGTDGVAYGVRLADLPIAAEGPLSILPDDTVLCMRRRPFSAEEDLYEANKRLFLRLIEAE